MISRISTLNLVRSRCFIPLVTRPRLFSSLISSRLIQRISHSHSHSMSSVASPTSIDISVCGHPGVSLHAVKGNSSNKDVALVLIHGGHRQLQNSSHWAQHHSTLSELGCWFAVDLPGHGDSKPGPDDTSITSMNVDLHCDSILSLLSSPEFSEFREIILVGRSYGGRVVQSILQQLKKNSTNSKVKRIVLIAPAIQPELIDSAAFSDLEDFLLVWSLDDPVVPHNRSEAFIKAAPRAQLETFSGIVTEEMKAQDKSWAGHLPENFQPEKFHEILKKFINKGK